MLPTRGRREWAPLAVACFLAQDYPDKELVILDDDDDPSFGPADWLHEPAIRYSRLNRRLTLADKRNAVNTMASGELIAHFDSDDWSDPGRLSFQLGMMFESDKAVSGFNTMLFYEPSTGKVAKYIGNAGYACGTSLVYRRRFWETHPFRKPKLTEYGSDNPFVYAARDEKQMASCDVAGLMVARIHPGNTSPNHMYKLNKQLTLADLPEGFPR